MRDRAKAEKRARELVAQMTLEEQAAQLKYDAPAIRRLGVEAYNWWNEGLHGVARAGTATVFPQAIGMAAAFDRELTRRIGDCVATEARAKYNEYTKEGDRDIYKGLTLWAPNINIFRDPRWGRGHETLGEDPYLTGELGKEYVKGLQGDGPYLKTAACAKHFAVHSGPENLRHEFDARVSPKDLYETYLPAFEKLVKEAGVEVVMGAYNRTNGEPCCGSETLLNQILRQDWRFLGHVVSDCWAIRDFHEHHHVTHSAAESAAMAIKAGCDLNCGNTYLHILHAYQMGLIQEEHITRAAERLFTTRFLLGMFDETEYDGLGILDVETKEHRRLAVRAAEEGIVLLKNDGILPLDLKKLHTIGVIGPNADSRAALIGNYHGTTSRYVTVLEAVQQAAFEAGRQATGAVEQQDAGKELRVLYSVGAPLNGDREEMLAGKGDRLAEARSVAKNSDLVILCLGLDETLEGEEGDDGNQYVSGDKSDLSLPLSQQELLRNVVETGTPVVLCMLSGSALELNYAQEHVNGILQAWYPGGEGGTAVVNILTGKVSPSGKLPVTFYRSLEQLPDFENYSMAGRTYRYCTEEPLYPFGYGLTYGRVRVQEVAVQVPGTAVPCRETAVSCTGADKTVFLEAALYNDSPVETADVLQVYVHKPDSKLTPLHPHLAGFQRVRLGAYEKRKVQIRLDEEAFLLVDEDGKRVQERGSFEIYVGTSQPDTRSRELMGEEAVKVTCDYPIR